MRIARTDRPGTRAVPKRSWGLRDHEEDCVGRRRPWEGPGRPFRAEVSAYEDETASNGRRRCVHYGHEGLEHR